MASDCEERQHFDRAIELIEKHIEQRRRQWRGTLRGQRIGNTDDTSWRRTLDYFKRLRDE